MKILYHGPIRVNSAILVLESHIRTEITHDALIYKPFQHTTLLFEAIFRTQTETKHDTQCETRTQAPQTTTILKPSNFHRVVFVYHYCLNTYTSLNTHIAFISSPAVRSFTVTQRIRNNVLSYAVTVAPHLENVQDSPRSSTLYVDTSTLAPDTKLDAAPNDVYSTCHCNL